MAKISQREARILKRRVIELERQLDNQRSRWSKDWPGGVNIDTVEVNMSEWYIVKTARLLGHAVVIVPGDAPKLLVYGIPLPKVP